MNRATLINEINYYLTHLRVSVGQLNSLNLQDINGHAEAFFRDLLNYILKLNFENINIVEKNARAIDLGDKSTRVAIQVTATPGRDKIKHTHRYFVAAGLDSQYDRLIVLIIGEKKRYQTTALGGDDSFRMSLVDDVWDMSDLLRMISDLSLPELERCRDFLRNELQLHVSEARDANEVHTLVRLIEVLSVDHGTLSAGDNREDPDPEHKIKDRFADHAEFLQRQYVDFHELYGRALAEVNRHSDLGHVRIRKLQLYLMSWSDRILGEQRGDPKAALDTMVDILIHKMGASTVAFDDGAVRYYLVGQLIACNVFPNKLAINA